MCSISSCYHQFNCVQYLHREIVLAMYLESLEQLFNIGPTASPIALLVNHRWLSTLSCPWNHVKPQINSMSPTDFDAKPSNPKTYNLYDKNSINVSIQSISLAYAL